MLLTTLIKKGEKIQNGPDQGVEQREHNHGGEAGLNALHFDADDDRAGQKHGDPGDDEAYQ